jgi:4-cresol dehydrogenase (hydroxylating) flavoprotein subunit
MTGLDDALAAWSKLLGAAHVVTDAALLAAVETATFATAQRVPAVLRPGTRDEVTACLRIASDAGVAVYPVSAGKNWGLGSSVPVESGNVLLDLSRLDRVLHFDNELGLLRVEPGVTFGGAYDYLAERGSRFFLSSTGASPKASLIGNVLERGDGAGPYSDRFAHVAELEVVLSTGEKLRGGFDRYAEGPSAGAHPHRWGVGPWLDGLFSQSNFGVVTAATFYLARLPRSLSVVHFRVSDAASLPALFDAIRELRMEGTLRAPSGVWNDYRVLSADLRASEADAPKNRDEVRDWAKRRFGGAGWFGTTPIYAATEAQGKAATERVREVLGPRVDFLGVERRDGDPTVGDELFDGADPAARFFQGVPHEASLRSTYWRKQSRPAEDLDPDRDRCGVHWLCAAVPLRGEEVAEALAATEVVFAEHHFEPLIAAVAVSERVAYLIPMVVYDRDEPGADERARACHDALLADYIESGWLPYRLGLQSMGALPEATDDSAAVLERIKRALDPAGVIAPGRYVVR